ncbi:MAG TPA: ABC transporter permease [Bacteroidales bacterium]
MISNFFKTALRNIKRNTSFSILNISGMTIGLTGALLLLLWVRYEYSFDRFHKNRNYLYRVVQTEKSDGRLHLYATTPFPLAASLKNEYPDILHSSRFHSWPTSFPKGDKVISGKLALVDKDFFEMINIEFVKGDKSTALNGPYDVVLTEEMAKRYFGDEDPFGKTITVDPDFKLTVKGVIKNLQRNSHFYSDCIASFEFYGIKYGGNSDRSVFAEWNNVYNYTFVELVKGTDKKLIEEKISGIVQRNMSESTAEIHLQNIRDIHLSSVKYEADIETGNITYVRLASLIAVLILIIASVNFMNLTTAQASRRAKEIGVRKVAGASRIKLILQFLGESLIIVFVAHIIAMILVELLMPGFKNFMYMEVSYKSAGLYVFLIAIVLFCGLLAGGYPAFYMSSLTPVSIMKGGIRKDPGNRRFIKILVVLQFTLSFLFIICTLIVRSQLSYIQGSRDGLNIKNVGFFEFNNELQRETLKNELEKIPDVIGVTITGHQNVLNNQAAVKDIIWSGKKEGTDVMFSVLNADKDYAKTFQLQVLKGNFLSSNDFSTDTTVAVINEKAASIMGFKDPVGEVISQNNGLKFRIAGVVKDFQFKSLHSVIGPLIITPILPNTRGGTCYIRMNPSSIISTIETVKKIFKTNNPDYNIDFKFLENDFNNMYVIERIAGAMLGYLTILAIIISCLGLTGLSVFLIANRTKEIGIRKVNGAKSVEIFIMLSKEYVSLVAISFLIASPVAWYTTSTWLRSYAYRTSIGWWVFTEAGVIVMAITIITIGFQSFKAASKNPVEALRYE